MRQGATTTGGTAAHARRLEVVDSIAALRADWERLGNAGGNLFTSWAWSATWWRHFGRDRPLRLVVARGDAGDVAVILPLYLASTRPLRVLRFLGHGVSDELGPICAPADRSLAADALRRVLAGGVLAFDLAVLDELPSWAAADQPVRPLQLTASPVADLRGGWDAWFAGRSRGLRSQLRRAERDLDGATVRTVERPSEVAGAMARLIDLHRLRWSSAGGSRAFDRREAFHGDAAAALLTAGWLRLRLLARDDRVLAATYNVRLGDAELFLQSGRDPAAPGRPGLLLHARSIAAACAEGATEYRLLRGDEPYKARLAARDEPVVTVVAASTARGRLALPGVARVRALPTPVRQRVPASYAWGGGSPPRWGHA